MMKFPSKIQAKIPTIKIKRTVWFMLHWRIGLLSALLVLWLVMTGVALNHSRDLGLDKIYLESAPILSAYNMDVPEGYILGEVQTDEGGVSVQTQDGTIELNADEALDVEGAVSRRYRGEGVPLEKLLLDLHTGAFFGLSGKVLLDLTGLALLFLVGSGIYNVWQRKRKRKTKRNKRKQ